MLITAVVCTYNRKELLEKQVATIAAMDDADSDAFEVVYVDNNSTDGTREEFARVCAGRPQFRYVLEGQQGSSFARNRGAQEARGEYVWFLDDDSLPDKGALRAYLAALPQWMPEVATGPIIPRAETPVPWWFDLEARQLSAYLARTDYGVETRILDKGMAWGPNLVVRKDVLLQVGGFSKELGVFGESRGGGEEDELQGRIFAAGGRLLYVHDAPVVHLVLPKQMVFAKYLRQRVDRGRSAGRELAMRGKRGPGMVGTAARMAGHLGFSGVELVRGRVASAVDHYGACFGLYGKWAEERTQRATGPQIERFGGAKARE